MRKLYSSHTVKRVTYPSGWTSPSTATHTVEGALFVTNNSRKVIDDQWRRVVEADFMADLDADITLGDIIEWDGVPLVVSNIVDVDYHHIEATLRSSC